MKRLLAAIGITIGATLISAGTASAHTPNVHDECDGLYVVLTNYESTAGDAFNNKVTITIDGVATDYEFDASFSRTDSWTQFAPHTWSVVIDANRNNGNTTQYDVSYQGTQTPCQPTTTASTTTTTTTTTTLAPTTTTTEPTTTTTCPDCVINTVVITEPTTTTTETPTTTIIVSTDEPPLPTTTTTTTTLAPVTTPGALPPTGGGNSNVAIVAAIAVILGVGSLVLARHRS
jgi:hypothetical protein